jgi:N-methylhydantoinase A
MEAAHGVHTLVGSNMAEAARVHAAERGLDLAGHTLVAFGGAGPVHAWSVARQLRISRVIFPGHAGVESALGFLAAAPAFEIARSWMTPVETLDESNARTILKDLAERARAVVIAAGPGEPSLQVSLDMRYRGQGAEIRVPVSGLEVNREELARAFVDRYQVIYGRTVTDVPVEVVTWRVRCSHDAPSIQVFDRAGDSSPEKDAPNPITSRNAWLPDHDAPRETPVYRRADLEPGMVIQGPALVEEAECTLVLGRGTARVLSGGTVLAEVAP